MSVNSPLPLMPPWASLKPPLPCAVLLDRDGTLIEDRHYLADPNGVTLLEGVGEALQLLSQAGCKLFVVSNQSGVGRGLFSEQAVQACQARLELLLQAYGVAFTDAVWCPHTPEENCACRKPQPGLWHTLAQRHGLTPTTTVMIGDKQVDTDFAANAGLALGILVLTGKGMDEARKPGCMNSPRMVVPNLLAAAQWITGSV